MAAAEAKIRISVDSRQAETGAKRVKGAFGELKTSAAGLGTAIIAAFSVRAIARFGQSLFSAAAKLDTMRRSLRAVILPTEDLEQSMEKLRELAKAPGMTFDTVLDAAIKLRAVGLSAEDSNAAIEQFGNALASVGKGGDLGGVALALGQIVSKGVVSAEEINQIAERLPMIRKAMQDAFGTANTEQIQKMGMTSTEFINGITGALGGLQRATAGPGDAVVKLGDKLTQLKAKFGATFAPSVVVAIDKIGDALDRLQDREAPVSDAVQSTGEKINQFLQSKYGMMLLPGPSLMSRGTEALTEKLSPEVNQGRRIPYAEAQDRRRLAKARTDEKRLNRSPSAAEDNAIFDAAAIGPLDYLNFDTSGRNDPSAAATGAITSISKLAMLASAFTDDKGGPAGTSAVEASSLAKIGGGGRASGGTPITSRLDKQIGYMERAAKATEKTASAVEGLNFDLR